MFVPVTLIVIGVVSILNTLGIYAANWDIVWPLLLIVLGLYMAIRRAFGNHCNGCGNCAHCKDCKSCKVG